MDQSQPHWSSVLQSIIKSTSEKQRLASALGLTTTTLSRWASGDVKPQRSHLIKLIQVLQPDHRLALLDALEQYYPDIQSWLRDDTAEQIPASFFAQVLSVRTITTESLRFWRISDMVLKQALAQLDPNRLGMAVKLVQCMPPTQRDGKIRSLRERAGKGTAPWTSDLEHDVHFLGLESMSGYAVEVRHIVKDDDLTRQKTTPAIRGEFEVSAAAHPIRFGGKIAGCLLASSTQPAYFSQQRLALLATFSDLIALAFDRNEFYDPRLIELRIMPPPEVQDEYLSTFRHRVTRKFQEASLSKRPLSHFEAEQQVWREIEADLIELSESYANKEEDTPPGK
jgi:transcriptional regulator with XRE-family HTH domain